MIKEVDLVKLGFVENYEPYEVGDKYASEGFIYYTLDVGGVSFYSVTLDNKKCKCDSCLCKRIVVIMDGTEKEVEITDILKLKDVILSLKRL